jgi:hypothetical protein
VCRCLRDGKLALLGARVAPDLIVHEELRPFVYLAAKLNAYGIACSAEALNEINFSA